MQVVFPFLTLINYFQKLNIGAVTVILTCDSDDIKIQTLKEMSRKGILSSFSINSIKEIVDSRSGAVIDVTCPSSEAILNSMSQRRLFSMDREWLFLYKILLNQTDDREFPTRGYISERNSDLYILPGSRVTLATYPTVAKEEEEFGLLFDMYRIATWTAMKYTPIGQFQLNGSLLGLAERDERMDFEGVTLRSGTIIIERDRFRGFGSYEHLEADVYAKTIIFVARDIGYHLNFSTTLIIEDSYGFADKFGNFSALMGYLQRNELDFISTGVIMLEDRRTVADFTSDVFQIRSPLIFKQPKLSAATNIYLLPFSKNVWIAGGVSSFLFGLMLYLSYRIGNRLFSLSEKYDLSLQETLTTIVSCLCQQGPPGIQEVPRGRIALFLFEVTIFFLFVAYSAKIVALLRSSVEKVKTISDLTHGPREIGIQDIIYNKLFFKEINDPVIVEFYKKKIEPFGNKAYVEPIVGLPRIASGMFAYKVEKEWANKIIEDKFDEKDKCGLSEIDLFLVPRMSIPVPKRSGLREHITRSVAKQRETGLLYRAKHPKGENERITCDLTNFYSSVTLIDFRPALDSIAIGALLAVLLLCLEILWKSGINSLKKKRTNNTGKI